MSWLIASALLALASCRNTPITGRRQVMLVPEAQEIRMGLSAYEEVLSEQTPSTNQTYIQLVNQVGGRIAQAAGRPDYQWEFRVVASEEMNAFALPGGKVAVYEGIFPVCRHEAGLAVVMSHEIAHALARHGGERMSQEYLVHGVGQVVDSLVQDREELTRQRIMKAYGLTSQYGFILPYSRKHESEADHMGLMLMARAGYDPREAPRFWDRFAALQEGQQKPLEFLSTHPSDQRRAADLRDLISEAVTLYEQVPEQRGLGQTLPLATRDAEGTPEASASPGPGNPNALDPDSGPPP
jgi:predicted Zn-dependent protease